MVYQIIITSLNEERSALIKKQITGKLIGEEFIPQMVKKNYHHITKSRRVSSGQMAYYWKEVFVPQMLKQRSSHH